MRNSFLIIAAICGLLSCKTTLIVQDIKTENIPNSENSLTIDSTIYNLVTPYRSNLEADMKQVIGISTVELIKGKPESKMTNYLADIFMDEGRYFAASHPQKPIPDVAFLNYGGLRTDLPKGDITVGKIFELMPFENEMVILKISGNDLYEFAERIAEHGGDCVAGMKMGIKNGKVSTLEVGRSPLNRSSNYWIVTNDYIANGGDGMKMFLNRQSYILTGIKIRDCFIDHMKKDYQAGRMISPQLDGRIYNE